MRYQRGLFIGRFQPIHLGHLKYIREMLKECDRLVIIIGSSQEKGTDKNPLSLKQRRYLLEEALVESSFPVDRIDIRSIRDFPDDDDRWFTNVMRLAGEVDVYYAGENDVTYRIFKDRGIRVKRKRARIDGISGTRIRSLHRQHKDLGKLVTKGVLDQLKSKKTKL